MAARLLRLSSFKGLQVDRWGLLRTHSAVSFCTRTEDPTKPGKKKKAAVKTAEAPDLRESLLAYKSTVGFPVRTPQPAVLLTHSVGDAESASTSSSFPAVAPSEVESKAAASSSHPVQVLPDGASRPAEDAGAEEVDTAAVPAAATEGALTPESGDPAAGETSSSSDSESDSDSDSDDEKSASAGPATSPEPQQSSAEKEEHSPELPKEQAEVQGGQKVPASSHVAPPADRAVHEGSGGSEKLELPKPSSPQTSAEGVEKVANEILEDDAPPVGSAISEASSPSLVQDAAQDKMQTAGPAEHPAEEPAVDIPEASVKCLAETEAVEEPSEPQNLSAQPPEAQSKASSPAGVTEELVDPGQSLKGAGELQLEEAPAPEPEPEEPFDNSTYKNYQHHSYNPYTFADLDLEMAKYRLPQPSSGRPSPRH